MSRIERGERVIETKQLELISKTLSYGLEYLFLGARDVTFICDIAEDNSLTYDSIKTIFTNIIDRLKAWWNKPVREGCRPPKNPPEPLIPEDN